jgi:hypothetical protein
VIDLLLPAAPKDYVKIPHVIAAVAKHIPEVERVCLVTPEPINYTKLHGLIVDCYTDAEVLPPGYDRSIIGWRPNWTSQQFIKLLQNVTDTEYWLTIDADTFFNQRVPFFTDDGKPILWRGLDQFHAPYFGFNIAFLSIGKMHDGSFLSECTLYKRSIMDELVESVGGRDEFIRKAIEIINTGKGHPADAEIYAAYVLTHYPDLYEIRKLKQIVNGRYGTGEYTEREIAEECRKLERENVQTFSLHSWDEYWN